MRSVIICALCMASVGVAVAIQQVSTCHGANAANYGGFDGSFTWVSLPADDVTFTYVERAPFTVKVEAAGSTVEGRRFYIGDNKVAIELVAHPLDGIFLQGVNRGGNFIMTKGATISVKPGYKKPLDLKPGDVYVVLPGIKFEIAEK